MQNYQEIPNSDHPSNSGINGSQGIKIVTKPIIFHEDIFQQMKEDKHFNHRQVRRIGQSGMFGSILARLDFRDQITEVTKDESDKYY
jgi:hypothetical protein